MRKHKFYSKAHYYRLVNRNIDEFEKELSSDEELVNSDITEANDNNASSSLPSNLNEETENTESYEFESPETSDEDVYLVSDDEILDKPKIQIDLGHWIVKNNISQTASNELLSILRNNKIRNLPQDVRTLLSTPRVKMITRTVLPGEYYHFGIQETIQKYQCPFLEQHESVEIDIGIDGLPLFKGSSQLKLWPIMGAFVNQKNFRPFLIGCYVGYKQPQSSSQYLSDFVDEVKNLKQNGILVNRSQLPKAFKIRVFSCDAPARSFLTEVMGHASINGCSKCVQKGIKYSNASVVYATQKSEPRTDDSFTKRIHPNHHHKEYTNCKTALEYANIGMVSQFPIEPMHLIDLGIMKKVLTLIVDNKTYGQKINSENISKVLLSLRKYVPREFQRKPRSLLDLKYWKATEFRQFLLYTGLIALKESLNLKLYEHFLTLVSAIRMLACPLTCNQNVNNADKLLENYVINFPSLYGQNNVSFNVHNLLHIADDVRLFGALDSFSAYKFENMMQELKKKIHRPNQILQQLRNRASEENENAKYDEDYKANSNTRHKFHQFELDAKREADRFCLIHPNIPIMVTKFNEHSVYGYKCQNLSNLFTMPVNSEALGIIKYSSINTVEEEFRTSNILSKYFRLPYSNDFVLVPLLHGVTHSFEYR